MNTLLKSALSALMLCVALPVHSAYWDYQPELRVGLLLNDNPEYRSEYESLEQMTFNVRQELGFNTEISRLALSLDWYDELHDHPQVRQLGRVNSGLSYNREGLRDYFSISARYNENSALTMLQEQAVGQRLRTDIGRYETGLDFLYAYSLTERWLIQATLGWQKISYEGQPAQLFDSDYWTGGAQLRYQLTSRSQVQLGASHAVLTSSNPVMERYNGNNFLYERDNTNLNSGLTLSFSTELSEVSSFSLFAGYRKSELQGQQLASNIGLGPNPVFTSKSFIRSSGNGANAGFAYNYNTELTRWSVSLSNSLVPGSRATVLERNNLTVTYFRYITERLSMNSDIAVLLQDNQLSGEASDERTFVRFVVGMDYRLTQTQTLRLRFQRRQQRNNDDPFLKSNVYQLSWWWRPQAKRW